MFLSNALVGWLVGWLVGLEDVLRVVRTTVDLTIARGGLHTHLHQHITMSSLRYEHEFLTLSLSLRLSYLNLNRTSDAFLFLLPSSVHPRAINHACSSRRLAEYILTHHLKAWNHTTRL